MKILVINSLYPPYHRGGAEVVVKNLVDELKKNHEVHIATVQPWKGFKALRFVVSQEEGISIHRLYPLNIFSFVHIDNHPFWQRVIWHILDALNIHSYIALRGLLGRLKPDLVLTHNVKGIGYTTFAAIRSKKIRTIHTVHDVQMIEPSGLVMWGDDGVLRNPSLMHRVMMTGARILSGSPEKVVFPSQFLNELYARFGFFKRSQRVVYSNPVPDDFFSQTQTQRTLRVPCHFLCVGQVAEHKGIRTIVEALSLVPDLDCVFTIAGDGALLDYVKKVAETDTRIRVLGRINREQVKAAIQEGDYTVVPSLCYENSPMSIIDALSSGMPVIAARIGGVAELVQDGENGYTFKPGDARELADILVKAARNTQYESFSRKAIEAVPGSAVSRYVMKLLS